MKRPDFVSCTEQISRQIGPEFVLTKQEALDGYMENTAALKREIVAVVRPGSTAEVQFIVHAANRNLTPLYPTSCGRNWGYGSRLPVKDGAILVDLSRMNRVRNTINLKDHFAVIEPGVTQNDLFALLQQSRLPLLFNATAAGNDTSILGNSLDRGFGYLAMRPDDLSGLEVVLGTGEILNTGYGHYENSQVTGNYKFGIGPALDGLFFQSNFGIVTSACLHLHPRRECHKTMIIRLLDETLFPQFIDILAGLRRECVFESVLHIGSADRARVTLSPIIYRYLVENGQAPGAELRQKAEELVKGLRPAAWTAAGGIYGTTEEVTVKVAEISKRLTDVATVDTVTEQTFERANSDELPLEERAILQGAKTLADFSNCRPTDAALLSPLWALGLAPAEIVNLDHTPLGLLFCCPALPLDGAIAKQVVATARQIFGDFGFTPYMTLNVVNTKAMLCVLNLVFDKRDAVEVSKAHRCVDTLFDEWATQGIYPYRLGIQSMGQFIKPDDSFWKITEGLKSVFDPNGIIAPGRYNWR
jgi:4-cresol dehydrogenase (hydroxylating)